MAEFFSVKISKTPFRVGRGCGALSGEVVVADEIRSSETSRSGVMVRVWPPGRKKEHWLDIGWLGQVK